MNIGLIDVDGHNFPNLALMKLAGWHKYHGDTVEWYTPFSHYDRVYMSKVFTFTQDYKQVIANADEIFRGGTGYDLETNLPAPIELRVPDYSIYHLPDDTAYGFLTRGCPNRCAWCVVPKKEGIIRENQDVEEIAVEGRKKLILLDNNILASGDYAAAQFEKIIRHGYRIDFNQAMDARLVDNYFAELLARCKWIKYIRFGCDTAGQIAECERAINMIRDKGYKGGFLLYTMLHGDIAENANRLEYWKGKFDERVRCHAQPYIDFLGQNTIPQWQKDMAHWCNRHVYYASSHFRDFYPRKGFKCSQYFK